MTATIPRQVVPCESCDHPTAGLLADCTNPDCFAALIDLVVREDRTAEAETDD